MQIVSNIALISINETLFAQLISFLIFLFIINRIMFRPLRTTMAERDEFIQGLGQGIIDTENEVENILADLRKREKAVKKEAYSISAKLEHEGADAAEGIHQKAVSAIAELRKKTEKQVDAQVQEAKKRLEAESEERHIIREGLRLIAQVAQGLEPCLGWNLLGRKPLPAYSHRGRPSQIHQRQIRPFSRAQHPAHRHSPTGGRSPGGYES